MKTHLLAGITLLVLCLLAGSNALFAQNLNLAAGIKPISSSQENADFPASYATDNNQATRWSSQFADPQSLVIDLGTVQSIDRVRISWEVAYAKDFEVQVSNDGINYTTARKVTGNTPVNQNSKFINELANLGTIGRYVRMLGTARATPYGYSIFEFEVYGFTGAAASLALSKEAEASNTQANFTPAMAFDGDPTTRWSTLFTTNQNLEIDLGQTATISRVYLNWEAAYGVNFELQVSADKNNWVTFATFTNNQVYYNEYGVVASGRYVRMLGASGGQNNGGFSIFELQLFGSFTPLPVSLTSFVAVPQGSSVAVTWTTATELNNAGFEVQRSANSLDFSTLSKVAGAGNSATIHAYHYLDAAPLATTGYYRLKQTDQDGKTAYGPVVAVAGVGRAVVTATISVYPNPTADQATVEWDASAASPVRWHLTSSTGQVVHTETLAAQAGHNAQAIDLRPYATGSYVLTVETAGQVLGRTRIQKSN
ncbi:discoidin domain-containing protein [Hymenobacter sp. H14-R3]|uniref:discoidin domain-containing protein n=1 Tax=Hymenobacter sp. H14-R3 TaxID=3046308 RepID=UPI0024B9C73D|nr:discoidin domain-containing protein [Hymenobacter sp. H14-R3]MDJ0365190.1 discoidin domain-containing protein [Hymenobacter sp. H14-R3]